MTPLSNAERSRRYRAKKVAEYAAGPKVRCACGCGELIPATNTQHQPARFKRWHYLRLRGPNSPSWKGGIHQARGYVSLILSPEEARKYPTARRNGTANSWTIRRSHLVWNENHPQNPVLPGEHVHHINGIRDDDRPENLLRMDSSEHLRMPKGKHHHKILLEGVR